MDNTHIFNVVHLRIKLEQPSHPWDILIRCHTRNLQYKKRTSAPSCSSWSLTVACFLRHVYLIHYLTMDTSNHLLLETRDKPLLDCSVEVRVYAALLRIFPPLSIPLSALLTLILYKYNTFRPVVSFKINYNFGRTALSNKERSEFILIISHGKEIARARVCNIRFES